MHSRGLLRFPEQQEHPRGRELLLQGQPPQGDRHLHLQLLLLRFLSPRWTAVGE